MPKNIPSTLEDDPLWYKDGVIYQLHVRSFFDSNNDGIGDFPGLTRKLDYLQQLGVTAIWILPFYPSPLRDDGYDIADYSQVNPIYGNIRDFREFLREAHKRGLRVITELVINHTSDQHQWFQRARRAKAGSKWRDFYVWNQTDDRYKDARIIFKDFETSNWAWDPVAQAYYWHRFYHHQPDLNFENPTVRQAVFNILDFWMKMGVDGLRLDAVPYLFEREGTICENLPETHAFLRELRSHMDANFKNRMLLAEANQWPEDAAEYFGKNGDECHVNFHFPLMPRLFMSVAMEDRFPIIDILQQTPPIPENSQWAVFLRNHDELTLEMVTDEDRDYMWKTYAHDPQARINLGIRRRLAPLLGNHRGRIELMNGLLFSFTGTPIIYYGDEIGMGDNIYLGDRNGVRTPMQWSSDRNAGFSRANPQRLFLPIIIDPEYHYEAINVEAQQNNPHSLLSWTRRLIDLRKRHRAFGRGSIEFIYPENRKVLVFVRKYESEIILIVANLSRFVQAAELDLSAYKGMVPVELFGSTDFPRIGELPYFLTLGPHSFYWFSLERREREAIEVTTNRPEPPRFQIRTINDLFEGRTRTQLAATLGRYLRTQRWFAGKNREIKTVRIGEVLRGITPWSAVVILNVDYRDGGSEMYQIPLAAATDEEAKKFEIDTEKHCIAPITIGGKRGLIYDATLSRDFSRAYLRFISGRKPATGEGGEAIPIRLPLLGQIQKAGGSTDPAPTKGEQSNSAVLLGNTLFLKFFRKLEAGVNSDYEVTRFLTENTTYSQIAPLAGAVEYRRGAREAITLALLQKQVPAASDAWSFTLNHLAQFFERNLREPDRLKMLTEEMPHESLYELARETPTRLVTESLSTYANAAALLGKRTAELHGALASSSENPDFRPEPFTPHYQRSIYQHMRTEAGKVVPQLRKKLGELPQTLATEANMVLSAEEEIQGRFKSLLNLKITGDRIRLHGDYHLGQVLTTGNDFTIIDFEGEPGRPLSQRRIKRSPLRDVAGMLRSFHYAPYAVLLGAAPGVNLRAADAATLEPAAAFWHRWVSAIFLRSYLETASKFSFLPKSAEEIAVLLDAYILEKAVYELGYELNNRPDWLRIPLRGILQILRLIP